MPGDRLDDWLEYQLAVHPREIDLGLDRVAAVAQRLDLLPLRCPSVIVAGTNGKGSCATLLAAMVPDELRVGVYTSPHLYRYNERINVAGEYAADADLVMAFQAIEAARGDASLTYFEFATLAALWLFQRAEVDLAILEVGLGGRLDAVNIVDADVALITQIGLDHTDWLGPDRESIGLEKAGIMRAGRPVLCADRSMPDSIMARATQLGARLCCIGRDFDIRRDGTMWQIQVAGERLTVPLDRRVLADNLVLAIAACRALGHAVAVTDVARACAAQAGLPGRREVVDAPVPIIYDVAHNAEAMAVLAEDLRLNPVAGRTHIVIGMLADKPVEAVATVLGPMADVVYPAGLDSFTSRGLSGAALIRRIGCNTPVFDGPQPALAAAQAAAVPGDRIVVCGSFYTVAQARRPCCS